PDADVDLVLIQARPDAGVVLRDLGRKPRAVLELAVDMAVGNGDGPNLVVGDLLVEIAVGQGGTAGPLIGPLEHVQQGNQDQGNNDPKRQIAKIVHSVLSYSRQTLRQSNARNRTLRQQIGTFIGPCQSGN